MFQNFFSNVATMLTPATKYKINDFQLIEEKLLSEGGYAYVYKVCDVNNQNQKYALKKVMIQDNISLRATKKEVEIWRKLGGHPNIVKYITHNLEKNSEGSQQMLILNELCEGGTLVNTIEKFNAKLKEKQVITIMVDIVKGVKHMHQLGIAHRDLKVENILFNQGKYKLADFGSSSTETIDYQTCTKIEISKAMERFEKYTTLMYRPPEMIDQYLKYNVNLNADVWMLGCILYTLCFAKHPFQEAQKLAIINAHYFIPQDEEYSHISEKMRDLIRLLLTPNPDNRPSIWELEQILQSYDRINQIQLNEEALEIKEKQGEITKQKRKNNTSNNSQQLSKWATFNYDKDTETNSTWDKEWKLHQEQNKINKEVTKPSNNTQHNPFQPFNIDHEIQDNQNLPQQNWFDSTHLEEETKEGEEDIDKGNGWAAWNLNGQQSEEEGNLSDSNDEEQPNMFEQINAHKQKRIKRKGQVKIMPAKEWCSGLRRSQAVKSNICVRTTEMISKFKEYMQKS